jgi:hypothetical protein
MLGKLAMLIQSKTALAVLGVVLVGGSGGAVAAAAATGHLTTHGVNLNTESASTTTPDSHAHTVGVEGLLTACSTTANTLTVKDSAGKSWTFVVSATTKFNGDTHPASNGASSAQGTDSSHAGGHSDMTGAGDSSAQGDNSAHAGDNSAQGDNSAHAGDNSAKGDNSAHADGSSAGSGTMTHSAPTLADVCTTTNIGSRNVQVQATPDGATFDAWKVTLQGPGNADAGAAGNDSSNAGSNSSGD